MTWKEKILEKWPEKFDEATFKEVYLTERDGCIPDMWVDGDITKTIREMFYYVLAAIRDEAYPDGTVVIEPYYEGSTAYMIVDLKTQRMLFYDTCHAWHFYFEDEEDFNGWCDKIAAEIRLNVVQVYLFELGNEVDAVCVRTPRGVYELYNSTVWDDTSSEGIAKLLSHALNVNLINLDVSKEVEKLNDDGIPWHRFETVAIEKHLQGRTQEKLEAEG